MSKNKVIKPFRRGKCQICWSKEFLEAKKLCPTCEAYASQDHVGQEDRPLLIDDEQISAAVTNGEDNIDPKNGPKNFENLLRTAKLTKKQRQVMRGVFLYGESLGEISKKRGISRDTSRDHYEWAAKKLKKHLQNSHIVRGKTQKLDLIPKDSIRVNSKNQRPTSRPIDPYLYYSSCPKCGGVDLQGLENKGTCTKCGWTFAVHSVEDLQNSHPYPLKPILDGTEY